MQSNCGSVSQSSGDRSVHNLSKPVKIPSLFSIRVSNEDQTSLIDSLINCL